MCIRRIGSWIDSRLGIGGEVKKLLFKPLAGGARYIFTFGSINLFLIVNQVLTGMFLMIYYVPSPDHAYDAVKFIQGAVPFGNIVRGLHFWGASAFVIMLILHVVRVYTFGAYKRPREIMWISGAVLLLLVMGFAFTGYLLPWDQKAYWATVVGTSIAGTAPVGGEFILEILRGGASVTSLTLTRFFTVHVILLPLLLVIFAGIHLTVLQIVDHTPPWDPEKAKIKAPFFPDQVFRDMVGMLIVFAALIFLANTFPASLEALADPTDKSYSPRPEWYFYALFQLLHYTEGRFEIIGTMVIPTVSVLVFVLWPFLDKNPAHNPRQRPVAMSAMVLALAGYITLTALAAAVPHPAPPTAKSVTEGRKLYAQLGCGSCHSINGVGGHVGPPLDGVGKRRARQWLIEHFKDPQKMSPGSVTPRYNYLEEPQLEKLTDYMESLK